MQGIGGLLVLLGAGSFVLHFLNMEFMLVGWVDNWGVGVGNGIRIAMIVVGAHRLVPRQQQAADKRRRHLRHDGMALAPARAGAMLARRFMSRARIA